jgi:hypothetical protein
MSMTAQHHAKLPVPAALLGALAGHFFTIAPAARHMLRPRTPPLSSEFRLITQDPRLGPVALTGRVSHAQTEDALVVVHGLGGDIGSHYVLEAVRAAREAGMACLRFNLRGSDRSGEDIYHAALTEDIHAILASEDLAPYRRVYLLGYSLGGHLVLRAASEALDPRVRAVAAVCPPIDLGRGARAIDEPARRFYRRHIMRSLKEIYAEVARRREMPLSAAEASRIDTIREWDTRIVAPRFGFASADQYYEVSSVAPRLGAIAVPALVVAARHDPMVPAETVEPALVGLRGPVEVRWIDRGGHVGFPARVDLGMPGSRDLEGQVVGWLGGKR